MVSATLTVTTWLLSGGPTSTGTDVREAVSRFIRDQRTPSVPVWAKIAAATAELAEAEAAARALGWPVRAVCEAAVAQYRARAAVPRLPRR